MDDFEQFLIAHNKFFRFCNHCHFLLNTKNTKSNLHLAAFDVLDSPSVASVAFAFLHVVDLNHERKKREFYCKYSFYVKIK